MIYNPKYDMVVHTGGVLPVLGILKHGMASAAEAETGARFVAFDE